MTVRVLHIVMRRLALSLAVLMIGLPPVAATSPLSNSYWNAVEIAPANGQSNQLFVHALSDLGTVVGSYNDAFGDRGFVWYGNSGQVPQRLPLSDAWGLAPDGSVLGVALGSSLRREISNSFSGREYAVQVAPNGAISVLTPTNLTTNNQGQTFGAAFAANASGMVVGVSTNAAGQYGSVLWSGGGGPTFIDISTGSRPGSFLAGRSSLAVNDAGMVVGGTNTLQTWSAAQGRTDLGGLALAISSSGADINNAGRIVGTSTFGDLSQRGFIYNPDTVSFSILTGLGGAGDSAAWALNERGDVVGLSGRVGRVDSRATLWRPEGEVVDLNNLRFTNLSGVRLQTAVDINNRGQILVSGMRVDSAGQITDTGLRHWVISQCARCGQIVPYPNPAGTMLDVGADWYDAHNDLTFFNQGILNVHTALLNKHGAVLRNQGLLSITGGLAGRLLNEGRLVNDAGAQLHIDGYISNRRLAEVRNAGNITLGSHALVLNDGFWEQSTGVTQIAGGIFGNSNWFGLRGGEFHQTDGSFDNHANADFYAVGALVDVRRFENRGSAQIGRIGIDGLATVLRVNGQWINGTLGGNGPDDLPTWMSTANADVTIRLGSFVNDSGRTELLAGSRWRVEQDAWLRVKGGSMRMASGSELLLTADAGKLSIDIFGRLMLESGSRLQSDAPVEVGSRAEVQIAGAFALGNGWNHAGTLLVQAGGRLQGSAGSGLVNDNGLVHVQLGGEVLGLGSFAQIAGTTMVDGVLRAGSLYIEGGLLSVPVGGQAFGASFVQVAGTTIVNGLLQAPELHFQSGELGGSGTLRGNVFMSNGVLPAPQLHVGTSPGTLTVDGDMSLDGADFELELGDRAQDLLIVTGNLMLGRLNVALKPHGSYRPDLDDSVGFIRAASITQMAGGSQVSVDTSALGSGWAQQFVLSDSRLQTTLDRPDAYELGDVAASTTTRVEPGAWGYSRNLRVDGLLEVAGRMTHRAGSIDFETGSVIDIGRLFINSGGTLSVLSGGVFSNRSEVQNFGQILNAGLFLNRAGAELGSSGLIRNDGVLNNDGLITLNFGTAHNLGLWEERGRLVVGPQAVFENTGQVQIAGELVNQGLIVNAGQLRVQAGATLTGASAATASAVPASASTSAGIYQQRGITSALTRVDGVLSQDRIDIIDGALEGTGRVVGALNLNAGTQLRPGGIGEAGHLTLEGDVVLSGGWIELAAGPDGSGLLSVKGSLRFTAGTGLLLVIQPGYAPAPGTRLELIDVEGVLTDANLLTANAVYRDSTGVLYLWSAPADQVASFGWEGQRFAFGVSAVPEPQVWLMWMTGLLAAFMFGRRKNRR